MLHKFGVGNVKREVINVVNIMNSLVERNIYQSVSVLLELFTQLKAASKLVLKLPRVARDVGIYNGKVQSI